MVLKKIFVISVLSLLTVCYAFPQNFNEDRTAMTNFIVRMYRNSPFEGVKVFMDYEHSYLLSVLTLDPAKYPNSSVMDRVAAVMAMSQASRYFNGSDITTDLIVHSTEHSDGTADSEIIETIKERSMGYVKALELLTSFDNSEIRRVFIYCKEIESK